jgi:hypothetical protein
MRAGDARRVEAFVIYSKTKDDDHFDAMSNTYTSFKAT